MKQVELNAKDIAKLVTALAESQQREKKLAAELERVKQERDRSATASGASSPEACG